jgi:hypothetical protein
MTSKIPKHAYQILLGAFILAFTVAACNSGGDKKEEEKPAMEEKKMEAPPTMQDTTKMDTGKTKPTDPGNR